MSVYERESVCVCSCVSVCKRPCVLHTRTCMCVVQCVRACVWCSVCVCVCYDFSLLFIRS